MGVFQTAVIKLKMLFLKFNLAKKEKICYVQPVDMLAAVSKSLMKLSERLGILTTVVIALVVLGLLVYGLCVWIPDGRTTIVPAPCGLCIVVVPLKIEIFQIYRNDKHQNHQ